MDELLGDSLGGLLRSSPRDGYLSGIFLDHHSQWDDEADREVAAVSWNHLGIDERNRKSQAKKNRKNISEVSKKLSMSAPILTMTEEPPILYSCSECPFLCTDHHFLTAHRVIQHQIAISNTTIFPEDFVPKKMNAKLKQSSQDEEENEKIRKIIVMVSEIIVNNLEKTREEQEIVLEEAKDDELESMNLVAESLLQDSTSISDTIEKDSISEDIPIRTGNEFLIHPHNEPPSKRRKKAQPRKLQISSDPSENDSSDLKAKKRKKKNKTEIEKDDIRAVEDFVNHVTSTSPFDLDCPLCHEKFISETKYSEHIEDIHMSWISPESPNQKANTNIQFEIGDFPIVPFSSVPEKAVNLNNDLEPWRKKYAKDCNKTPPQSSRSQQCPLCSQNNTLMSPNEFKTHMITVHRYSRALTCHQCFDIFDDIEKFVKHSETHLHKPFICEICDLTFTNKKEQARHRKTEEHRNAVQIQQQESSNQTVCVYNENLAVKCPSCEFRCSIIEELEIHLKNESHYHPCNHLDCKEYFRSKNKLQNHLAIAHGGSQAFLCDQCGKPFRLYATLLRHKLRNHNKQNHKKCEFCSSTFHDNYKLKRHIRSKHSQEKPHHCPECGKSFARKDKLQDHMWSHSKGKIFYCHVCKKAYSRPDALKAHERIHFLPFRFECKLCNEKFQICADYTNHCKKVHNEDKDEKTPKKDKTRKPSKSSKNSTNEFNDILAKAISMNQLTNQSLENSYTEVISGECNESRITELQPVEVTVGASSLVHSIQKKYSRDSNSCSPTILHPVNETDSHQFMTDGTWITESNWMQIGNGQAVLLQNRPSLVPLESKYPNYSPTKSE